MSVLQAMAVSPQVILGPQDEVANNTKVVSIQEQVQHLNIVIHLTLYVCTYRIPKRT